MASTQGNTEEGRGFSQLLILGALTFGLYLLHRVAPYDATGVDARAVLSLGFIVLSGYTVGLLVEAIKLPHITGYLLAGLVFGPSAAVHLGRLARAYGYEIVAPFDTGVIGAAAIQQLSFFDTLAIAMIALTAGGELHLDQLKKGARTIASILASQFVIVMIAGTTFFIIVSGALFPSIVLPGLGDLTMTHAAALGAMVASIVLSPSPAATIAVITETRAAGPMTRSVLSSVVLMDVVVIVTFVTTQGIAAHVFGADVFHGGLGRYLVTHIFVSLAVGAITGGALALYVQYVGRELLIFLVGTAYTVSYACQEIGLDPVLTFLAAGFVVSNYSKAGHRLIDTVERLSLPVYVVFFTLAGAKLRFDDLIAVFGFAVALSLVRAGSVWTGFRIGTTIGRADEVTRKYGWMGFIAQAGVAISLASTLGRSFGEIGRSLETLLIGGIALNELVGPVLLKLGLGLSGELNAADSDTTESRPSAVPPPSTKRQPGERIDSWPPALGSENLWGPQVSTGNEDADARIRDLGADLRNIVRDVAIGPLNTFESNAVKFFKDLRREFLRHHRRVVASARADDAIESASLVAATLRLGQAELAANWRGIILGRSVAVTKRPWSPGELIDAIDAAVDSLPEHVRIPYAEASYINRDTDWVWQRVQRKRLRAVRAIRASLRASLPAREVHLRALSHYHVAYDAPVRLEGLAALFVEADRHLVARARSLFEGIVKAYDDVATRTNAENRLELEEALEAVREGVEEELTLALEEVERVVSDGTRRTTSALSTGYNAMKRDVLLYGTHDLPTRARRSSKRFADRIASVERLTSDVDQLLRVASAQYSSLAMELELLGVETKIRNAVDDHVGKVHAMVRRRAEDQALRAHEAVTDALASVEHAFVSTRTGEQLATELENATEVASKIAGEAARVTEQLSDQLDDETRLTPLLDSLGEYCRTLTPKYRILVGRQQRGEWRLPQNIPMVEVPFREAVLTYVDSRIVPRLIDATRDLAQKVKPLTMQLNELERVNAFNVELANTELEDVQHESVPQPMDQLLREMIPKHLGRVRDELRLIEQASAKWPLEYADTAHLATESGFQAFRLQLVDGKFSRAHLDAMKRSAAGLLDNDNPTGLVRRLHTFRAQTKSTLVGAIGEERIEAWRAALGLAHVTPVTHLTAGMFSAPEPTTELPLVYRRLFSADTLEASNVLTGRDAEVQAALTSLENNTPGRQRSVVLLGVDGVGKSTVASAIIRLRRWKNVRRVSFDRPATMQEVDNIFIDASDGQLVVVDGIHWMLSMEPGGFEPLRRFVAGVINERGRRRWLTYADPLTWEFAATVAPLNDAFSEVVNLKELNATELQSAVIARHRLSGYGHAFDRGKVHSPLERIIFRSASRIRRPFDHYFQELHTATGGLVRDALRLWLASIREIDTAESVVNLGPVPASSYSKLRRLPDDLLLNLYQIARVGWMSPIGQARLYRIDENAANAQLSRMVHLGLLTEKHGVFRIAVHLRGAAGQAFRAKGWMK